MTNAGDSLCNSYVYHLDILLVFAKVKYGFLTASSIIYHGQFSLKEVFFRHPVQKRFLLAEQGSPPQYCFKKVVIQKLSSTECSLELVLTEEKKTELGLGEQYSEREDAG